MPSRSCPRRILLQLRQKNVVLSVGGNRSLGQEALSLACRCFSHSVLGREAGVSGAEKFASPIQGIARDGPNEIDESLAVRGLDVDLSPKIVQNNENNEARERKMRERRARTV